MTEPKGPQKGGEGDELLKEAPPVAPPAANLNPPREDAAEPAAISAHIAENVENVQPLFDLEKVRDEVFALVEEMKKNVPPERVPDTEKHADYLLSTAVEIATQGEKIKNPQLTLSPQAISNLTRAVSLLPAEFKEKFQKYWDELRSEAMEILQGLSQEGVTSFFKHKEEGYSLNLDYLKRVEKFIKTINKTWDNLKIEQYIMPDENDAEQRKIIESRKGSTTTLTDTDMSVISRTRSKVDPYDQLVAGLEIENPEKIEEQLLKAIEWSALNLRNVTGQLLFPMELAIQDVKSGKVQETYDPKSRMFYMTEPEVMAQQLTTLNKCLREVVLMQRCAGLLHPEKAKAA